MAEQEKVEVDDVEEKQQNRSIGRWYIGETLGKGGYSWVKKGYDKKTGKCVALKFMAKAEASWADEQTKQVITEIEALKNIRHQNVMKLYAYNLNAKYPTKNENGDKIEAILLVLEYAPGGELFDILYYTSALEEHIARTYFRQTIFGLEACHNAGVVHRDLKPQNLLLDSRFNLKITDFGLSKVFESDEDSIMKTTYVGTRGYQAPELLLNKKYDLSCDIFSCGVVLFILLTGYPPFEQASPKDRWFSPLCNGDYAKFWKLHRGCNISSNDKAKDLIQRMLEFDPKKRITIDKIKKHEWFNDKFLEGKELIRALRVKHRAMESKRCKDARKMGDLQDSVIRRPIPGIEEINNPPPLFPEDGVEGIYDTYTVTPWKDFFNAIYDYVASIGGETKLNWDTFVFTATLKMQQEQHKTSSLLRFEVQLWKSREFQNVKRPEGKPESDEEEDENEPKGVEGDEIFIVRLRRLNGDVTRYKHFENMLMRKCAGVFTGLPDWAQKQADLEKMDNEVADELSLDAEQDDYDRVLELEEDEE